MSDRADVAIIGGGIIGLATAYQLLKQRLGTSVIVIEKEAELAFHQTGRNSGVLHSGIYYKPGSLRAVNCREGKLAMERFCEEEQVPYERCGKVIVAVDETELPRLETIYERGQANGVRCELIDVERLREIEPHAAGVRAIHVPESGIVDYRKVSARLGEKIVAGGSEIRLKCRVTGIERRGRSIVVETSTGAIEAGHLVNCAGLHVDRITRQTGMQPAAPIVPFRGEYYELKPDAERLCRGLIYPTPDPSFPFLGVHFTRMIGGGVECGPNAVLAFAREGYTMTTINVRDLWESLTYAGFLRLAARHWRTGCGEMWRSISKRAFVRSLQRLVPAITTDDLRAAPSGVRAQALGRDGQLVDDFVIERSERIVNVGNTPSPAATASLNIGRLIVEQLDP